MLLPFIKEHGLPTDFIHKAEQYFIPLAEKINQQKQFKGQPLFIGINGCQGSGKSTLTDFLSFYLQQKYQLNIINLSLDDFYLSKQSRLSLAKSTHPLLATRGVPGTHDTQLLSEVLTTLKEGKHSIKLPRFNKSTDDLYPETEWQCSPKKVDIVLLEGWCWGAKAQSTHELATPVNDFEQSQDTDGAWRTYVNEQLKKHYEPLYPLMDHWLMLKAPSFDSVENWRWQQEEKLAAKTSGEGVMTKEQVKAFIQYYQRLTEVCLTTLTQQCDWLLPLDNDRKIEKIVTNNMTLEDVTMNTQSIIYTDLDGTLLDHFDYSFDAAKNTIHALKKANIPVVPNTSKTYAEVTRLQEKFTLTTPFIIENGAAVYIPIDYFPTQPEDTSIQGNYWVKEFCPPREHWLSILSSIGDEYQQLFQGFSALSCEELCNLTGLTPESAEYAIDRKYTEPLLWHGDNENKSEFVAHMESLGAHMLQGGRFLHVGGHTDKGIAMTWLTNVYAKQQNTHVQSIALGDSHNDNAMLETADFAMQIKSPIHPFPILNRINNSFRSTEFGPKGWAECLNSFFLFTQQKQQQIGAY